MSNIVSIAGKLGSFVRLLSSDRDGEVLAAARAMIRVLHTAGADIHVLADHIEHANGKISEADMRRILDAGRDAGRREIENKIYGSEDFANADGTPSWHRIAVWCQRQDDRLRKSEAKFISDMASSTLYHEPTEKQAKWLKSIFLRLGGKLL